MNVKLPNRLLSSPFSDQNFQISRQYANQRVFLNNLGPILQTAPIQLCASWPLTLQNSLLETEDELREFYRSMVRSINDRTGSSFVIKEYLYESTSARYRCKYSKKFRKGHDCRNNCHGKLSLTLEEQFKGPKRSLVALVALVKLHHGCLHDDNKVIPSVKSKRISNSRRTRTSITLRTHSAEATLISDSLVRPCQRLHCLNHIPSNSDWVLCESCRLDLTRSRTGKSQSPFVCARCKLPRPTPVGGYITCDSCRSKHAKRDREYKARQRRLRSTTKLTPAPSRLSHVPDFLFTPSATPSPSGIQVDALSLGGDEANEDHSTSPPGPRRPPRRVLNGFRSLSQSTAEDVGEEQVGTEGVDNTGSHRQPSTSSSSTAPHTPSAPASEFVTVCLHRTVAEELLKQIKMSGVEVKTEDESNIV
ncbi:hypothetical protein DL96DRAFT_1817548 [Flagelloscypha sp. PMI_526]|nr:hypothetical protein DL96DRAFT_1817548 [Flagelloscypha sp. PMI_526]